MALWKPENVPYVLDHKINAGKWRHNFQVWQAQSEDVLANFGSMLKVAWKRMACLLQRVRRQCSLYWVAVIGIVYI